MTTSRLKTKKVVGVILLLGLAAVILLSVRPKRGRLRLPVGTGTPAVSLGERHGLILASDGSLWSWGADFLGWPVLGLGNLTNRSTTLRRIGNDTNWVDVGFGERTVMAIKSDGTLWAWGQQAHVFTGASETAQDVVPTRVGKDSDWQSIAAAAGWWCLGLTKKDGSLWLLDASAGKPNGPEKPYQPVRFGRAPYRKDWVAYAAGAVHAAPRGVHGTIGVALTRSGEVWTWGLALGDPPSLQGRGQELMARLANLLGRHVPPPDPPPVFRRRPWQLRNE